MREDAFSRKKKAMHTSKILLVSCVVAVLSAQTLLAAKPETEAQAKMREALRLKMEELNVQQPVPETAVVAEPVVEIPKVEIKPVPMPKVKKAKTVVVSVPSEPVVPVVVAPVAAPTKAEFSDASAASDTSAAAHMRDALQAKMNELNASAPAPITAPVNASVPVVVAPAAPAPMILEAPASPLPVTKQDRLAELLRRYKADEISALDYHGKRAAILAE